MNKEEIPIFVKPLLEDNKIYTKLQKNWKEILNSPIIRHEIHRKEYKYQSIRDNIEKYIDRNDYTSWIDLKELIDTSAEISMFVVDEQKYSSRL